MYKKSVTGWLKHFDFMLLDLAALFLGYGLAVLWRFHSLHILIEMPYRSLPVLLALADVFVVFFFESFKNILKRGYWREACAVIQHASIILLITVFYLFLMQDSLEYSRAILLLTSANHAVFTYLIRILWKYYLRRRFTSGKKKRSMLVVAETETVEEALRGLTEKGCRPYSGVTGLVLVDQEEAGAEVWKIPVVCGYHRMKEYICRNWVDEVFIYLPYGAMECQELLRDCAEMGVTAHACLGKIEDLAGRKESVERMGNYTVLTESVNLASPRQIFLKRLLDICGGLIGCVITGVLFLFIAPMIYIKSPGSVFFRQTRVGRNGKPFQLYKFRSMYPDAEQKKAALLPFNEHADGLMFKMGKDPRVIPGIGEFIRRFSIDEFPQFFNVLKGEMSLVGTRPPTVDEWEQYEPRHRVRLSAKPGITGLWQISGRSNITDFEQVVKLDKKYIAEWNLGMDVRILMKTVKVVLEREGAA